MAIDPTETALPKGIDKSSTRNRTTSKQRQEYFMVLQNQPCSAILEVSEDGRIDAHISGLSHVGGRDLTNIVKSSAEECKLNVYASAKPSKDDVFMNRAKSVALSSSGNAFRIGSRIFYGSESKTGKDMSEHFDVPDLSLYIDHIERHGKYLFVTSRQKLLEIPGDEYENGAKKKTDKLKKALLWKGRKQDEDTSGSDSETSDADSSVESEALSAYESWSEASTEYSEAEILQDTRPQYTAVPGDGKSGNGKKSTSDDEEDPSTSSEASNKSDNDDSDVESVEAPNTRYAHVMDDEEEDQLWDVIWQDPDEPTYDGDEYKGAWTDSEESEGGVQGEFDGDSDSDSTSEKDEAENDKADKKSEKEKDGDVEISDKKAKEVLHQKVVDNTSSKAGAGIDGSEEPQGLAKSQVLELEEKPKTVETAKSKDEEPPSMLGEPVAQLQVFDLSASPRSRIFRFTRPTMQLVRDSAPAVHSNKSLIVWPLGDNNILFADYKYNTYFIRKFRTNRFWSQHVKIECRFSENGQYLHVASLEMQRSLPVKKKKSKPVVKGKDDKATESDEDEEKGKATSKCDLLVLTYKLSQRKTTRAPPVLMHRTQVPLGEVCVAEALPTFTWAPSEVFVTQAINRDLKVFRISLFKVASGPGLNGILGVQVPKIPIEMPATEQRAEVYFLLPHDTNRNGRFVITREQPAIEKSTLPVNGNTKHAAKVKGSGDGGENFNNSDIQHGSKSSSPEGVKIGADIQALGESESKLDAGQRRVEVLDVSVPLETDSWKDVDMSELVNMVGEGAGQMEVEMVKFDRTDDCDCCDD